jgi:hypothetical protein
MKQLKEANDVNKQRDVICAGLRSRVGVRAREGEEKRWTTASKAGEDVVPLSLSSTFCLLRAG